MKLTLKQIDDISLLIQHTREDINEGSEGTYYRIDKYDKEGQRLPNNKDITRVENAIKIIKQLIQENQ